MTMMIDLLPLGKDHQRCDGYTDPSVSTDDNTPRSLQYVRRLEATTRGSFM